MVQLKMVKMIENGLKRASSENYLVATILTSGLVIMATSVGSLASYQKKSKIDHLWSSESIKERLFCCCCCCCFLVCVFVCFFVVVWHRAHVA